ncbi:MAG TPA: UDP-glucose/GDP-mannose dehydrogenase family protein [Myxococcota bacterium]|nr:UDP-glucose/GDP-mannose dehydrogenase family protein [Myxococcota bacterium]
MKISIVGTGYVGLVTGACLADRGHDVTCIDVDRSKVDAINERRAPIHEVGLDDLLARHVGTRLRATADLAGAVAATDVTFIAVGTPAAEGRIDLQYVEKAAVAIGEALRGKPGYHAVIVKSTVIPGTTDGPVLRALEAGSGKRAGADFGVGMNPEFLTEGQAVADFMNPDRIVLGGIDARTHALLESLYEGFAGAPRILTNPRTAELIKYASNALLATAISFSNEIARLCAQVGDVDVVDVMRGVHESAYLTARASGRAPVTAAIASFLGAGCGFGGSCLPKDVTALAAQGEDLGLAMPMLRSVLAVNAAMPDELVRLVKKHHPDLAGVRVAVLGLAFKPDTDDLRESPAFPVLRRLRDAGATLTAFDPIARPETHPDLRGVRLAASLEDAVASADVVVLVTRWAEFGALPDVLAKLGRSPLVVDGRRMLPKDAFARYEGIGWERKSA